MKLARCIVMGDHGRTQTMKRAQSKSESFKLNQSGWIKLDEMWYRGPDTWLVDLADYLKIQTNCGPIVNLAYFKFIKELVDNDYFNKHITDLIKNDEYYRGFDCALSTGKVLETEFRIFGTDKRLYSLKKKLFENFINSSDGDYYQKYAQNFLGKTRVLSQNTKEYEQLDKSVKKLFNEIKNIYINKGESIKYFPEYIPNINTNLPEHDMLILVPKGCFKYFTSLVDENNCDKINFLELHTGKKDSRYLQYFKEPLIDKQVLAIDTVYTGDTLNEVSKIIKNNGGYPIKLGLFPKNKNAIKKLDHFIFGDMVFKSQDVQDGNDWYLKQYKEVFSLDK